MRNENYCDILISNMTEKNQCMILGRFLCESEDFVLFLQPVRKRGLKFDRTLSRGQGFVVFFDCS